MSEKRANPLAEALSRREPGDNRATLAERLAKQTGRCLSANGCRCEAYEQGSRDVFGWQLCVCTHTNHSHEPADR